MLPQVVGGLWTSWFKRLVRLSPQAATAAGVDELGGEQQQQLPLPPPPPAEREQGMGEYFDAVADEYSAGHTYDLTNRLLASWQVPPDTDTDALMASLRQDCLHSGGRVDLDALERLVRDYAIRPRLTCIHCKRFSRGGSRDGGTPGGGLLCSSCERAWVQAGHTDPPAEAAAGGGAGDESERAVAQLLAVARQAEQAIARPWAWRGTRSDVGERPLRQFLLGPGPDQIQAQPQPRADCKEAEEQQQEEEQVRGVTAFAADVGAEAKRQVRKRHFLSTFYIKVIILPRQARDKHRKNSKKVPFSSSASSSKPQVPDYSLCWTGGEALTVCALV